MALTHARVSLAFSQVEKVNEAARYRRMAIEEFRRHKDFNEAFQEMLPVTPSPSSKDAEQSLFFMVGKLDEHARQKQSTISEKP